ncbi:MAG: trigger factor [Draconibacterium sp.]|nr:MAG: trigger factor [Draconibacterium sp.]
MNITRENIDNVNAVIKVNIVKADYEKPVSDQLKEYRQKATVPGFRPGKAPVGLIKRKYGTAILVDEVNKLLSKSLSDYVVEEKLNILGELLPNKDQQKDIDWETDEDFEFAFDAALAPEIKVSLDKRNKFSYYNIAVSEDMIDEQVDMAASQMGQNVPADITDEKSSVRGNFIQLDENDKPVEEGIRPEGVLIALDMVKDSKIKKELTDKKVGDTVTFDPVKAFENRHEVGHMLNISHEEADVLNSNFSFTINEILRFEKAEINIDLFKKLYGDDTEVKTMDDFRARIKEEIKQSLKSSSDYKFTIDTRDALIKKINPELPEDLLKRWLQTANKELSAEQIDSEFGYFIEDLKWQLIKDEIIKKDELKVVPEEVTDFAKRMAQAQYAQYGLYNVPEEQLESFSKVILQKPEEQERIYKKLYEDKVVSAVKEKVTLEEKEVSREEFDKLMKK